MTKSLLFKLFGIGKLSKEQKRLIENENCILYDEGIKCSVTYHNFKAPGKHFKRKTEWCVTSIVLTEKRLTAQRGKKNFLINIQLNDKRLKELKFSVDQKKRLVVSFDVGLFHDNWSGIIDYKFKTEFAINFVHQISIMQKELL